METYESDIFNRSQELCYDSIARFRLSMDHLQAFLRTYKNRPSFAFQWYTEISHDDMNIVNVADDYFSTFIKEIKPHLNNTVLFLISDHGNRYDHIRYTAVGRLEGRLPMFSISVPDWLKKQYPKGRIEIISPNHVGLSQQWL